MNKTHTLELLQKTFCRLQPSSIEGVGVFAVKEIPEGVNPFEGMRDDFFVIEKNGTVRIPQSALNGMDMSFYVNNSDHPNLTTTDGFLFITSRLIKPGEELTVAYAIYDEKYATSL
ncbi:hypothetical protein HZA85_01610 [Candidatus Uhrbacteria bacterium]|nr:hypothetical protein [Candidatus Uhrbacteria bacterium]